MVKALQEAWDAYLIHLSVMYLRRAAESTDSVGFCFNVGEAARSMPLMVTGDGSLYEIILKEGGR
jgi:hypothetical protein